MSRTVYVNGEYLPEEEAKISVFDRGFLMADAVYEVTAVLDGRLCDYPGHAARLHRSLSELQMSLPVSDDALLEIHREMVRRNGLEEGGIYLHGITRASVLKLAKEAQMRVEERPFTIEEAQGADEAFITSASQFVCPVVEIDERPVGGGAPGPVARRLREIYVQHARDTAI